MNHFQDNIKVGQTFYVSITGLRLKNFWSNFPFMRYAFTSFQASKSAPGNLYSAVKTINGIRHSLTAWESKEAMRKFVHGTTHTKAIKVFRKFFTGKMYGYESTSLPTWEEVHKIWKEKGIEY